MNLLERWERFWFQDVRGESFAVLRIALGAAGLLSMIGFMPIDMFWAVDGIAPLPGSGLGLRGWILESGLSPVAGWIIFLALAASFLCMTAGLFTGTAVAACFLGSVVQSRWNSLPLTSGHTIMVAVLFCIVWADCSGYPSVDAWRKRGLPGSDVVKTQPIWPLRLVRAQVAFLYMSSGLFKLLGEVWRDGSAVYYTTNQNVYGRIFQAHPVPAGFEWVFTLLTYLTLAWELAFPILLWNRTTRAVALLTGVGLHLGIWATMEVGPFSWVMLASYVAFLDPRTVSDLMDRWVGVSRRALPDSPGAGVSQPAS